MSPLAPMKDAESARTVTIARAAGYGKHQPSRFLKAAAFALTRQMPPEMLPYLAKAGLPANYRPTIGQSFSGGLNYLAFGDPRSFFPPGTPLSPMAPPGAEGRQFDYPFGANYQVQPRAYESVSFEFLRSIGDSVDLLRAAIEYKKNIVKAQDWDIIPVSDELKQKLRSNPETMPPEVTAKLAKLRLFFKKPDNEHTFSQWVGMIVEDILVIDAPAIFIQRTLGSGVHALVPIDGATLNRKVDYWGRTPVPPVCALQQVLKGLPAIDYSSDQILYFPQNVRTGKAYGFGPVESVPLTIDILLRRTLYQRDFYAAGANPNVPIEIPDEWTVDQAREFGDYWNTQMQTQSKRWRAFPLPGGAKLGKPMSYTLKDEMDDWLARIICFRFAINCTALVKQMNRASGQQQSEESDSAGTQPLLKHLKENFDALIKKCWGFDDVEFVWKSPEHPNMLQQAQADHLYIQDGVYTINEVRNKKGMPPRDEKEIQDHLDRQKPQAGAGGRPLGSKGGGKDGDKPDLSRRHANVTDSIGDKMAKAAQAEAQKKRVVPITRLDPEFVAHTTELSSRLRLAFARKSRSLAQAILAATASAPDSSKKKSKTKDAALLLLALGAVAVWFQHWLETGWMDEYQSIYDALAAAAVATEARFGGTHLFDKARLIAAERAAQIVGMSYSVTNHKPEPNATPDWTISDDVRDSAMRTAEQAVKEGWTEAQLTDALLTTAAFNDDRADVIAITETGRVVKEVAFESAKTSGQNVKRSVSAGDDKVCETCLDDEAEGWIPIDQPHSSGTMTGQRHPKCRCSEQYSNAKDNPNSVPRVGGSSHC